MVIVVWGTIDAAVTADLAAGSANWPGQLPDEWYDLHNPQTATTRAALELTVSAVDFSTDVERSTRHRSRSDGIVSTRLGNGAPWTPVLGRVPFGSWSIVFPETAKVGKLLEHKAISDVVLVISYTARTPEWPL